MPAEPPRSSQLAGHRSTAMVFVELVLSSQISFPGVQVDGAMGTRWPAYPQFTSFPWKFFI